MSRNEKKRIQMARLGRALPLTVAVALSGGACARPIAVHQPRPAGGVGGGCQSDTDCKAGRVCEAGSCVAPGMTPEMRASVDAGDIAVEALRVAIQSKNCHPFSGLEPVLERIGDQKERDFFMGKLAVRSQESDDPAKAFGEWLYLVEQRSRICPGGVTRDELAAVAKGANASVSEKVVDAAVRSNDCASLAAVNALGLWPFEQRFVNEVASQKFQEAEVSRRLWLDTLETFQKECHKRLSRRESTEVEASADKLRRIVGLDDDLLIGLRSKLMNAIAEGKADQVQKYLSAVTEREKALDTRNAAMYEAKMRTIEAELKEARAEAKAAAATAAAQPKSGGGQPAAGSSSNTADDIKNAVETTKAASEAVDVARSLFGF